MSVIAYNYLDAESVARHDWPARNEINFVLSIAVRNPSRPVATYDIRVNESPSGLLVRQPLRESPERSAGVEQCWLDGRPIADPLLFAASLLDGVFFFYERKPLLSQLATRSEFGLACKLAPNQLAKFNVEIQTRRRKQITVNNQARIVHLNVSRSMLLDTRRNTEMDLDLARLDELFGVTEPATLIQISAEKNLALVRESFRVDGFALLLRRTTALRDVVSRVSFLKIHFQIENADADFRLYVHLSDGSERTTSIERPISSIRASLEAQFFQINASASVDLDYNNNGGVMFRLVDTLEINLSANTSVDQRSAASRVFYIQNSTRLVVSSETMLVDTPRLFLVSVKFCLADGECSRAKFNVHVITTVRSAPRFRQASFAFRLLEYEQRHFLLHESDSDNARLASISAFRPLLDVASLTMGLCTGKD